MYIELINKRFEKIYIYTDYNRQIMTLQMSAAIGLGIGLCVIVVYRWSVFYRKQLKTSSMAAIYSRKKCPFLLMYTSRLPVLY